MHFLHICRENSKSIVAIFALVERLPTSAILKQRHTFSSTQFSEPKWKRGCSQPELPLKKTLLVGWPILINFVLKDKKAPKIYFSAARHTEIWKKGILCRGSFFHQVWLEPQRKKAERQNFMPHEPVVIMLQCFIDAKGFCQKQYKGDNTSNFRED